MTFACAGHAQQVACLLTAPLCREGLSTQTATTWRDWQVPIPVLPACAAWIHEVLCHTHCATICGRAPVRRYACAASACATPPQPTCVGGGGITFADVHPDTYVKLSLADPEPCFLEPSSCHGQYQRPGALLQWAFWDGQPLGGAALGYQARGRELYPQGSG